MGFELDRLMKQYGLGTAGVVNYSGSTPEDTAAYDAYKKEYQTRLQNTPMMMQSQYQTGNEPKSAGLKSATDTIGVDQFNKNIQNWANLNPTAFSGDINAYAQKYGISGQDIFNATQNRWGNILQAPKFNTPAPFVPPVRPPVVPPVVAPVTPPVVPPYVPPYIPPVIPEPVVPEPVVPEPVVPEPVVPEPVVTPPVVPEPVVPEPVVPEPVVLPWEPPPYVPDPEPVMPSPDDDFPSTVRRGTVEIEEVDPNITIPDTVGPNRAGGGDLPEEFDKYLVPEVPSIPSAPEKTGVVEVTPVDPDIIIPDTVGPNRAGGGDLPEEFDKYLVPETPAVTPSTPAVVETPAVIDTPMVVDTPFVTVDSPVPADDGTTSGIQDAIDSLETPYEVQPWENVDNSGFSVGSMAGDNSLNSGGNTYIDEVAETPEGLPDAFGSYPSESTYTGADDSSNAAEFLKPDYFGGADDFGKYGLGVSEFGGGGGGGKFFDDNALSVSSYAKGGQVKTHYQTAGRVQLPSGYETSEDEADFLARQERDRVPVEINAINMASPPPPVISEPVAAPAPAAPLTAVALNAAKDTSMPVAPAVAAAPAPVPAVPSALGSDRMANIQALLSAYGPKDSAYGEDLKAARAAAKAESDAFAKMLSGAMKSPEDEKSSKAEMYFRLAAAFGAPTKTGHFAENLGMVGKELGEYSKDKRASARQKLALALEGQKMKMTAAKEDLNTLRTLAGKEMDDKRAIATELIKDYIKSGEPQSAAGKQALDEGFKAGTPEYQKRVQEIGNMNIEGKLAQITASLAGVNLATANFALAQEKFQNQKTQQAKLTGPELKMKTEAEDLIASSKQSLLDLKQAYALNPNSLAGGWLEKGQQFLSEAAGSKDPVIVNTRIINNLLGSQGLAKLKATFGGAPTEGERAILMELEGIGSKTREERAAIIKRTYKVLQDRMAREQARLDQINSGAYRMTTPLEEGND